MTPSPAEPLVTLVTPVYNGEKYLRECIESVLNQTYTNWEYIIVNNCSTDRSLEIAQSYASRDARIRIRTNHEHVGVMRNHNIALQEISPTSKYCKVLQADDWLFPNCLSEMVKVAEANPTVGIVGSYCLDNERVKCDGLPFPSTVVPGRTVCRSTLLGHLYLFWSPSALLIRSDLIRNSRPFYPETHLHGDDEALYQVLGYSDFGFVHQVLTYVRRHEESVTASTVSRLNAKSLAKLDLLVKYGPVYLSREEYALRLRDEMRGYYRLLARNLFRIRARREFWKFHQNGLQQLGHPLSATLLLRELSLECADICLTPKRLARSLAAIIMK